MASKAIRIVALGVVIGGATGFPASPICGADEGVAPASHVAPAASTGDASAGANGLNRVSIVRELMKRRGGEPAAAAQLVQLVREFQAADACAAFDDLAVAHERAGQINLAAEARLMAVQAYPQEPAARAALLWLTRLYASCEVAHRCRPAGQETNVEADRGAALYAYQLAGSVPSTRGGATGSQRGDEPALAFTRAVAARRAGVMKAAGTLLATLKHAKQGNPWGDCARAEGWLEAGGAGEAPKRIVRCTRAADAPQLDGVLDEACWASTAAAATAETGAAATGELERAKPQAADAARPETDVRWVTDGEYLYIAIRCDKAAGVAYPDDRQPRTRDAALAAFDRVRLLIDLDRDYATCFELTVDSRGWTQDACWGDATWNPEWFVAAGEAEGAWVAELAIGLDQLGAQDPTSGAAWAVAIGRALPESGDANRAHSRAANQPSTPGPESFDVLLFE